MAVSPATIPGIHGYGLLSARPTAGQQGALYWATDASGTMYRDNGTTWDTLFSPSAGGLATSTFDVLGSNVSSVTASVFVDILTHSLVAGTYLVRGSVTCSSSGANNITIRLTDGTTTYASTEQIPVGANYPVNLAIEMRIVLAATTTVHLTGCASGGTATFYASTAGTVSVSACQLITSQSG